MKFALVDGDKHIHELITKRMKNMKLLKTINWDITCFSSAESFLSAITKRDFDILILSIKLEGMDGIELSQYLKKHREGIVVIFLSSYDHYMREAFGTNVHSYILKQDMDLNFEMSVEQLVRSIKKSVFLKTNYGRISINIGDIECIIYTDRKPVIYTKNKKIEVYAETITSLHKKLPSVQFTKPNSGSLVNIKYIKFYNKNIIDLEGCNHKISISRGCFDIVKKSYIMYHLSNDKL